MRRLNKAVRGADRSDSKLTAAQVEYIRNTRLNACDLAGKFKVCVTTIRNIQLGKTYKNAGGCVRKMKRKHLTCEQKVEVCRRYRAGSVTQKELAEEFGIDQTTVSKIINRLV